MATKTGIGALLEKLSNDEIKEIKDAFCKFDHHGSGTISSRDVVRVLRSLGQNPTEVELIDLMNHADIDEAGQIDFPEFLRMTAQRMQQHGVDDETREAFRVFAKDDKGHIPIDELRYVLSHIPCGLSKDDIDNLLQKADSNIDGSISYEEFVAKMFPATKRP